MALVIAYTAIYTRRRFELPYCFQIRAVGSFLLNWFIMIYICVPSLEKMVVQVVMIEFTFHNKCS